MLLFLPLCLRFQFVWIKVHLSESYKNKHKTKKVFVVTSLYDKSTTTTKTPSSGGVPCIYE